jgi:exopolysaccharide biosynthesis protein
MKKILSFLFFALICLNINAQQSDSVKFTSAAWVTEDVAPGVVYKYFHFTGNSLFSSNQFISVLEIDPSLRRVEIFPSPVLKETSAMASEAGAIAAINGSFFKFNYTVDTITYNSVDYIRKNFKQLAPNYYKTPGKREQHQLGALAVLGDKLYIIKADHLSGWENYIYAKEVLTTGPLLIKAGAEEPMTNASFYVTRHPRTSVAIKKDGKVLLITVDGRAAESAGVSLPELMKITEWLGAADAINLDGGGSTTMYIKGKKENGVVNHPSDNKKFDNQGERKVANSVFVL